MPLIECVPNISEGRRRDVVDALAGAVRAVPGVALLDCSSDASHHRSVFTFAGNRASIVGAVLALYERAIPAIDLRLHRGEHPRMGAVDVVPFVPLQGETMAACVALAEHVGRLVADRFHVPVFLYELAARSKDRRNLADVRRGGFEGLAPRMAAGWLPDFGPLAPHPTAGASAIGARMPLIAFNVNLATTDLAIAQAIAALVRHRTGGLPSVKALGIRLAERGLVQVSMNLTDYTRTPIGRAFDRVRLEARRRGVEVLESEIVGLAPSAALKPEMASHCRLRGDWADAILEHRLRNANLESST